MEYGSVTKNYTLYLLARRDILNITLSETGNNETNVRKSRPLAPCWLSLLLAPWGNLMWS